MSEEFQRETDRSELPLKSGLSVPKGAGAEWLTDRIEEIREATEHRDETLAMIAHELRTPLTVIQGGIWVLRNRVAKDSEEGESLLAMLEQQSTHLGLMLTNMLSLAASQLIDSADAEPIVIREEIRTAVTVFQAMSESHVVKVDAGAGVPLALSRPGYVQEILVNLLVNAHKYSPPAEPIEVRAWSPQADEVHVSVADHGEGVPAGEMEKIFESYYQSSRRGRGSTGSGLGLAVCKRLAEAQGGAIWASQTEGGGLKVTFTLKACAPS